MLIEKQIKFPFNSDQIGSCYPSSHIQHSMVVFVESLPYAAVLDLNSSSWVVQPTNNTKDGGKPRRVRYWIIRSGKAVSGGQLYIKECNLEWIRKQCAQGRIREALDFLYCHGLRPNRDTYGCLLRSCSLSKALREGRIVHAHLITNGYAKDRFLGNLLIDMYAKCMLLQEATDVFDLLPDRNLFTWNNIIAAYAQHGECFHASKLLHQMEEEGLQSDVVSWTLVIGAIARLGHDKRALHMFRQMKQRNILPNRFTFGSILMACAGPTALIEGKIIHASIIDGGFDSDVVLGNALITMYAKCGSSESAKRVFEKLSGRDIISWNAMITAYAQDGNYKYSSKIFQQMLSENMQPDKISYTAIISAHIEFGNSLEAFRLFQEMQLQGITPDKFTVITILGTCSVSASLSVGKLVHVHIILAKFHLDDVVCNALIDMYGKCGSAKDALDVFCKMRWMCVISWTSMIAAYAENGYCNEALQHFQGMLMENMMPDSITIVSIIEACTRMAALEEGKQMHYYIVAAGLQSDVLVSSALLSMYSKCGSLDEAMEIFNSIELPDLISWNAVIASCAQHGNAEDAVTIFRQMQERGIRPNHLSFLGVISACSHAGLLDEGCNMFSWMIKDHNIPPTVKHFGCLIDYLGRVGWLFEAEDLIISMPLEPSSLLWVTILGACTIFGNKKQGKRIAKHILLLNAEASAPYVLLSNIYATANRNIGYMGQGFAIANG